MALKPAKHDWFLSDLKFFRNAIQLLYMCRLPKRHIQQVSSIYKHVLRTLNFYQVYQMYEGHLESKERFAIKKYLLIIGKKKNMQVLSHAFTYFST